MPKLDEERSLKLDQLRARYQAADSKPYLDGIEQELSALLEDRESLELPVFKKFAEVAIKRVNSLSALLLNDESLLNEKGLLIAQQRDLWRGVLGAFDVKSADDAIRTLDELIDDKLNAP